MHKSNILCQSCRLYISTLNLHFYMNKIVCPECHDILNTRNVTLSKINNYVIKNNINKNKNKRILFIGWHNENM